MGNKWEIKLAFDDELIRLYNWARRMEFHARLFRWKYRTSRNAKLKNLHKGERCFIVGNGPSIRSQDLTLLKDETTFFCNFFYKHEDIRKIQPTYYSIFDPKLETGEWPSSMLGEVIESCPGVTLLLAAQWQFDEKIKQYEKSADTFWIYGNQIPHKGFRAPIDLTRGVPGDNVVKISLFIAIYMGFREIYILGVDNDGTIRDMLGLDSHFYGGPPEPKDYERDLWWMAQGFRGWAAVAERFENSHKIVNLTAGGLLYPFPRQDYDQIMAEIKARDEVSKDSV